MADDATAPDGDEEVLSPTPSKKEIKIAEGVFTMVDGARYEGQYAVEKGARIRSGRGVLVQGPETSEGDWANDARRGDEKGSRSRGDAAATRIIRGDESRRPGNSVETADRARRETAGAARPGQVHVRDGRDVRGRLRGREVRGRGPLPVAGRRGVPPPSGTLVRRSWRYIVVLQEDDARLSSAAITLGTAEIGPPPPRRYSGGWKDNKMHGDGCYTDTDKVNWQGQFHNGKYFNGKAYATLR